MNVLMIIGLVFVVVGFIVYFYINESEKQHVVDGKTKVIKFIFFVFAIIGFCVVTYTQHTRINNVVNVVSQAGHNVANITTNTTSDYVDVAKDVKTNIVK